VTGFEKIVHVCTRIEINLIAYCNSHTSALSRHNNKTGVDKQVCFYRWPVIDPVKSRRTIMDPVRPLRDINRVACGPILSYCTSAKLVIWSGLLWPSVWLTVHITWSPVYESIVNPPTFPLHPPYLLPIHPPLICAIRDIAGCFQNFSQNQPVQSVAMYVSTMIAIALLYFWCKSYVATTKHK